MTKNEKVLVTGGSGFIGTNLIDLFSSLGKEVLNIDFNKPKKNSHFAYWQNIDITNFIALQNAIQSFNPEFVVHLAARTDLNGKTIINYNTNTVGTQNLIKILNQTPSVKRVIFTSSMLVCKPGYIPNHQTDYAPSTVYGESKVLMEKIIRESSHNYDWTIVRPTSIWGPWFGEPYRNFFDMVINKKYFHIGNKSYTKTYGYVENLFYQIDAILNTPTNKIHGKVFYLGDYEPTNIKIWANEIAKELDISIKTVPFQLIKFAALSGDILKYLGIKFPMTSFRLKNMTTNNVVDLSNIKEIAPDLPFGRVEGIKKTLKWLKNYV